MVFSLSLSLSLARSRDDNARRSVHLKARVNKSPSFWRERGSVRAAMPPSRTLLGRDSPPSVSRMRFTREFEIIPESEQQASAAVFCLAGRRAARGDPAPSCRSQRQTSPRIYFIRV